MGRKIKTTKNYHNKSYKKILKYRKHRTMVSKFLLLAISMILVSMITPLQTRILQRIDNNVKKIKKELKCDHIGAAELYAATDPFTFYNFDADTKTISVVFSVLTCNNPSLTIQAASAGIPGSITISDNNCGHVTQITDNDAVCSNFNNP